MFNEVYLILDNIRSIYNVGAIFRTADGAGIKKVYLCGITAYPSRKEIKYYDKIDIEEPLIIENDKVIEITYLPSHKCYKKSLEKRIVKTALKSLGHVDWEYKKSTLEIVKELKQKNINIISLEQTKLSVDYKKANYKKPIAIVVGNEVLGVTKEVLKNSDQIVEIPMHGVGKSLNVATAVGIILYKAIETQ